MQKMAVKESMNKSILSFELWGSLFLGKLSAFPQNGSEEACDKLCEKVWFWLQTVTESMTESVFTHGDTMLYYKWQWRKSWRSLWRSLLLVPGCDSVCFQHSHKKQKDFSFSFLWLSIQWASGLYYKWLLW